MFSILNNRRREGKPCPPRDKNLHTKPATALPAARSVPRGSSILLNLQAWRQRRVPHLARELTLVIPGSETMYARSVDPRPPNRAAQDRIEQHHHTPARIE